jgi:SAM-dependent methyltransferase
MIDAEHWDIVYTDRGERGVSWFTETPTCSLELLDAAHVGPERSLIDVGAGASRLVDAVLARGHTDVTALDVSARGLKVAQERLGAAAARVDWVVSDVLAWRPVRRFGVWHDRAVFHFLLHPGAQARYLALLDTALQDDGIAVIGTFAEDGPVACSGLPTARYSVDELLDVLGGTSRWVELACRREHHLTPSGADQPFSWLALQRRSGR